MSEGETLDDKRKARKKRAAENQPRPVARKGKGRSPGKGVGMTPATDPADALAQMRRSFSDVWLDDEKNPAIKLIASEHHLAARLNTYAEGRWQIRRVGDDAVIALVELQDGTRETRRFTRGVIDDSWKRS